MLYNGFVYLAKSDTGHYKIGRSKNPYGRVRGFDTSMPVGVELIHYFPCDDPVYAENRLHKYYKEYRVSGEWFNLPEVIVSALCRITHGINRYHYAIEDKDVVDKIHHCFRSNCCVEYADKIVDTAKESIERRGE